MKNRIVVISQAFQEQHRRRIAETAERLGYQAAFFRDLKEADALQEADILFAGEADAVRGCPGVRWVCSPSAGVEHLIATHVFDSGEVELTNSAGCYGVTISEHLVMVILMLLRRQMEYSRIVSDHGWRRDLPIRSIRGARITILGTGDIGREATRKLRGFQPAVIRGLNRSGKSVEGFDCVLPIRELKSCLPDTDILIMALPGTAETNGLMNAEMLNCLPAEAYLVNVGRGNSLDQHTLEQMLRVGRLAGASLDVFEREPIPADSSLWDCPNLLITPHTSGNMTLGYTVDRCVDQFLEDLENEAQGKKKIHLVDVKAGY